MHMILTLTVLSVALAIWLLLIERRREAGQLAPIFAGQSRGLTAQSGAQAENERHAFANIAFGGDPRRDARAMASEMASGITPKTLASQPMPQMAAQTLTPQRARAPESARNWRLWPAFLRRVSHLWRGSQALKGRGRGRQSATLHAPRVEDLHDPAILAGALSVAVLAEGPTLEASERHGHMHALGWHLNMTRPEIRDTLALAASMLRASGGPKALRRRLSKRLTALAGPQALAAPICVIEDVLRAKGGGSTAQRRALRDLRFALGG